MNRQTNDIETAENCAQSKTVRVDCGVGGEDSTTYADDYNFPLPDWAKSRSNGDYMVEGSQLATRDGRRCGNAYIDSIYEHERFGQMAVVITDIGSVFRMTLLELAEAFYPPEYIMDIIEARSRRSVSPNE